MIPALRHRAYALFFVASFASSVGTWMQNVARAWVIYRVTGDDPMWLGWLALSVAGPMVLLPPISGRLVDRFDRVRVLAVTQAVGALIAVVLAVLAARSELRPFHLLVSSFVQSCALAVDNPTRHALIGDLVGDADLPSAVALNAAGFTGAAMIGPAIAGALLHGVGATACFAINALSFGFVLALLPTLSRSRKPFARSRGGEGALSSRVRTLLVVAAIAAISVRAHPQLLPVFATRVFAGGPRVYGAMLSAGGIGALSAAVFGATRKQPPRIVTAIALLVTSLAVFVASRDLRLSCLMLMIAGAASTMLTTTIATELQRSAEPAARGRVLSLHTVTLIGLPSLGGLLLAALADRFSERIALTVAIAVALVTLPLTRRPKATASPAE